MMRTLFILPLIYLAPAWADCDGKYADHIIQHIFDCKEPPPPSLTQIKQTSGVQDEIIKVCEGGCEKALLDSDKRRECDKKYALILLAATDELRAHSKKASCRFDRKFLAEVARGEAEIPTNKTKNKE